MINPTKWGFLWSWSPFRSCLFIWFCRKRMGHAYEPPTNHPCQLHLSQQMSLNCPWAWLEAIFLQWHGLWYSQYRQQVRTTQVNRGQIWSNCSFVGRCCFVSWEIFPALTVDIGNLRVGFVTYVFHLQTSLSNTLATWMALFCNGGKYSWKRNEPVCCCFYHLGGGFKYFSPTWGDDPISLIFFRWVETTT